MYILIVEDSPHMRRMLVGLIRSSLRGSHVLEAADGRRALMLCQVARPALVLMDVHLPDANGIELTAEIKSLLPESIVVIISNDQSRVSQEAARAAGAAAYVVKDDVYEKLLPALMRALGKTTASPGKGK